MLSIGNKIKEYRKKSGMTQEQLASRLNVTFQTVSKWETGAAFPDLSMLLPLTRLFGISADELLGFRDREPDKRYTELKEAYDKTYKTEDFAKRQQICETAVAEFPGDMKWLCNLAWVISNRSFEYEDNDKYFAEQEKAIKLFDAVIGNCKDELLRGNAIIGITQLLGWRGRKDEAMRYAELLPERLPTCRDEVMEYLLSGEELVLYRQKKIWQSLWEILRELSLQQGNTVLFSDKIAKLLEVMIPDGNFLDLNHHLYCAAERKVNFMLSKNADDEQVLPVLGEMKQYALDYDRIVFDAPGVYKYTSPLFDRIETDSREWFGNEGERLTEDFFKYLREPKFDFLRDRETFKKLLV